MSHVPLWEHEEKFLETRIKIPNATIGGIINTGKLLITNFRIASAFPALGVFYQMPHDMITSFKWDSGFRKGNNFKITWFESQQSIQVHYQTKNKKKIVKLLEKMSYYDQPAVLKFWSSEIHNEYDAKGKVPENILKIRYANGDITKEEYEEMKYNLNKPDEK